MVSPSPSRRLSRPLVLLLGCSALAFGCQGGLTGDSPGTLDSGSGGADSHAGGTTSEGGTGGGSGGGGRASGGMGGSDPSGATGGAANDDLGGFGGDSGTGGDGSGGGASCHSDAACHASSVGDYLCVDNGAAQCVDPDEDGCLTLVVGDSCGAGLYCSEEGETSCVSGDSCAEAIVVPRSGLTLSGDSFAEDFGDTHSFTGEGCEVPLGDIPEAVFALKLKAGEAFLVREFGFVDSMVGIMESCEESAVCLDSWDDPDRFGFEYVAEIDETVFVWVTAYSNASEAEDYEIRIDRWLCGDGITSEFEECDDGNDNDFDGCTSCLIDMGAKCEIDSVPSLCEAAPDLGTFAGGDAIVPVSHETAVQNGDWFAYQITFSEPVWLSGTLAARGTGDPRIVVRDTTGSTEFSVTTSGSEAWAERSLAPGTYFLEVIASGDVPLGSGFNLSLSTIAPFHLGTLSIGGQLAYSGTLPLQYDTDYFTFDLSETTVISGSVVGTSGDPDFFVLSSAGVQVVQEASGGSTEDILDHELPPGRYYARVRAYVAVPSYDLTLLGATP